MPAEGAVLLGFASVGDEGVWEGVGGRGGVGVGGGGWGGGWRGGFCGGRWLERLLVGGGGVLPWGGRLPRNFMRGVRGVAARRRRVMCMIGWVVMGGVVRGPRKDAARLRACCA